jgi:plastocyanin
MGDDIMRRHDFFRFFRAPAGYFIRARGGATLACAILFAGLAIAAARADDATVNIDNFSFAPAAITVPAGTKITWNNRDDIPHTITDAAEQRAFKSPPMDTGDVFSHVFPTPGTYHYFCSLHPHMRGTVVVQ